MDATAFEDIMRWIVLTIVAAMVIIGGWRLGEAGSAADISELLVIDPKDICRSTPPAPDITLADTAGDDDLPIDITITPALRLIDHRGERRTRDNLFKDRLSLVFFGYASCEGVCLMAIPAIADAAKILHAEGSEVQPVLITIDPERDTPEYLGQQLGRFNERFVGLTGPEPALVTARRMFNIQANPAFEDAKGTVFQHGSFIYLVDAEMRVVSMLPPVLPPEHIARIARNYL